MKLFPSTRVLIVDDNRQMRVLVRELLRALDLRQCAEAGDMQEGLSLLRTFKPALVITDLAMGKDDGLAFCRAIRTNLDSPNSTVPIVMMTGHAEMSRVAAAIDAGANTFLAKPISARALADHVALALNDRRPFVRASDFFGPDRRRRRGGRDYKGPFRRYGDPEIIALPADQDPCHTIEI